MNNNIPICEQCPLMSRHVSPTLADHESPAEEGGYMCSRVGFVPEGQAPVRFDQCPHARQIAVAVDGVVRWPRGRIIVLAGQRERVYYIFTPADCDWREPGEVMWLTNPAISESSELSAEGLRKASRIYGEVTITPPYIYEEFNTSPRHTGDGEGIPF